MIAFKKKSFNLRLAGGLTLAGLVGLGSLWSGCAADEVDTGNSSSGTASGTGTGTGTGTQCPGATLCGDVCVDTNNNPDHCGSCDSPCDPGQFCVGGQCSTQCGGGTIECGNSCVNIASDENHCGGCDNPCDPGEFCVNSTCQGTCTLTDCGGDCVDTNWDPTHCGDCTTACDPGQVCVSGLCSSNCGPGLSKCDDQCVNLNTSEQYCGDCNTTCTAGQDCVNGNCIVCDSNTTDCDGDGWMGSEGDCCDKTGACGLEPELVNPGAIEVSGNGIDDNCNGLVDLFDSEDTLSCDTGLNSNSSNAMDYAKAMGLCRVTEENPADPASRTWGVISAELLRADGSPLGDTRARSIRTGFGSINPATLEGSAVAILSSGIAADATQTNPGPNGGPGSGNVSTTHTPSSTVNIGTCADPKCIDDWFAAANPPVKNANELSQAPGCPNTPPDPTESNDSVMLYLRIRTPTNVKAFSFFSYFFSAEYPEWVCSSFNDQFVALVDTPGGIPQPIPNPPDKNLLVYSDNSNAKWPIGINVAAGTNLFSVCNPADIPNQCQTSEVDPDSCQLGQGQLIGTGFEASGGCLIGGGTFWLTTTGNIIPGDILELRIVIWDVGDSAFDSLAILDGFDWLTAATVPGTG